MPSICRFQRSGGNALWLRLPVFTLFMKMLANANAIFVPMVVQSIWNFPGELA